jgi:hypothetical protein
VIFSGKKSKKVKGLYKPDKREIIIHNRNFDNDNLLLYTVIHELTHHIQFTEHKQKSARSHTQLFYAVLDDLIDIAEEKGIYKLEIDKETQNLIDEAKDISREIAKLQRKPGQIITQIHENCEKKGIRYDDVTGRKVQISRKTTQRLQKAFSIAMPEDIGVDIQEAALSERDEDKRNAIIHAGQTGKSVAQAKRALASPPAQEGETVSLMKEKSRLERTIASLERRLEEVMEQLNHGE